MRQRADHTAARADEDAALPGPPNDEHRHLALHVTRSVCGNARSTVEAAHAGNRIDRRRDDTAVHAQEARPSSPASASRTCSRSSASPPRTSSVCTAKPTCRARRSSADGEQRQHRRRRRANAPTASGCRTSGRLPRTGAGATSAVVLRRAATASTSPRRSHPLQRRAARAGRGTGPRAPARRRTARAPGAAPPP